MSNAIQQELIRNKINKYFDKIINLNEKIYNCHDCKKVEKYEDLKQEIEKEYIGTILLDGSTALSVENKLLSVNELSDYKNKLILDACNKLYNQRESVDIVTVSEFLNQEDMLEQAGGRAYINDLALNALDNIRFIIQSPLEV